MNTTDHNALAKIADACADEAEILALSVVRMLVAGYATGDVACWDMAYCGAERLLRPEAAGRLVASLTTMTRTVRAERTRDWQFMPATCCRVTRDEEAIVCLIASARAGKTRTVKQAASDVIGSSFSPRLESAAQVVAGVLDEILEDLRATVPECPRTPTRFH